MAIYLKAEAPEEMVAWQEIHPWEFDRLDIGKYKVEDDGDVYVYDYKVKEADKVEKLTARQILEGMLNGDITRDSEWVKQEPKKYYLRDIFINGNENQYLNINTKNNTFTLSYNYPVYPFKTKFTDREIEELEIPIERFAKIEVED